jgi:RNA polymerase sigma-70 factor (ECF subfamily)
MLFANAGRLRVRLIIREARRDTTEQACNFTSSFRQKDGYCCAVGRWRWLPNVSDLLSETDSPKTKLLGLYAQKRANLVRFFAARLNSRAEAEDLVQDLYIRISGMEITDPIESPSALLHRIGSNLMLDRLRSQKRSGARDTDWRDANVTVLAGQDVADQPSADEIVDSRQRLRDLVEAVAELPEKTRQAFSLHKLEGLGHAETARRMNISVSTVEKHISSALATLTRRLR